MFDWFAVSTTNAVGQNPILALGQAGYPVSISGEKERNPPRQLSPAATKTSFSNTQTIHMGVVPQAYSISQREASPPGQVGNSNAKVDMILYDGGGGKKLNLNIEILIEIQIFMK